MALEERATVILASEPNIIDLDAQGEVLSCSVQQLEVHTQALPKINRCDDIIQSNEVPICECLARCTCASYVIFEALQKHA